MKYSDTLNRSWYADFETTTAKWKEDEARVFIWGIKRGIKKKLHIGFDIKTFFTFIIENEVNSIFFHNLNFDGNFIFKALLNAKIEFIKDNRCKEWADAKTCWTWIANKSGIFTLTVKWYTGLITKFNCSWRLVMMSISKMGELFGEHKLTLNYNNENYFNIKKEEEVPKELLNYLERDIDLIIKTLDLIKKDYELSLTIASTAMADFKKFYGPLNYIRDFGGYQYDRKIKGQKNLNNVLRQKDWDEIKKSYYGGYTYVNEKYIAEDLKNLDGYSYDVNSLYPYIMLNKKMPFGKMYRNQKPRLTEDEKLDGIEITSFVKINMVYAFKKKKKYPNILRSGKRSIYNKIDYVSEVKNVFYTFHVDELKFISKYYDLEYIILDQYYFKTKYIFKDWVNGKKHLKENARNNIMRTYHKIILNSLYGKTGQNYILEKKTIKRITDCNEHQRRHAKTHYGEDEEYIHIYVDELKELLSYIPIASYITTQARIELWSGIFTDVDNFIYCDTDSIYSKKKNNFLKLHPSEFGAWKPESRFNRFKALRGKCYLFNETHFFKDGQWIENKKDKDNTKRKISGLPKKAATLVNFNNFNYGLTLPNVKLQKKEVKNGILLLNTDYTLKEAG